MKEEKITFLEWAKSGSVDHRITVINLEMTRKWRERQLKEITDKLYSSLLPPMLRDH